jgi:hypothetical protein
VDLDEVLAATFALIALHLTERQRRLRLEGRDRVLERRPPGLEFVVDSVSVLSRYDNRTSGSRSDSSRRSQATGTSVA